MKAIAILTILSIAFFQAGAQTPMEYASKFQRAVTTEPFRPDSALFYAQKATIGEQPYYSISRIIHMSFAREFLPQSKGTDSDSSRRNYLARRRQLDDEVLGMMAADPKDPLYRDAKPIMLWVEAQENANNEVRLKALAHRFIEEQLSGDDLYSSRTLRYGLLIYKILAQQPGLQPLATHLLTEIKSKIESNMGLVQDLASGQDLEKRGYYRYLYANIGYFEALAAKSDVEREAKLKTAFDYSPDLVDRSNDEAYIYDALFLHPRDKRESFQEDYLNFLLSHSSDKTKILAALTKIAVDDPEQKHKLKEYYEINVDSGESFESYWVDVVDKTAEVAPPISLALLDGKLVSQQQLAGKWTLVDFWGTWCEPCREEHPTLQSLYDSLIRPQPEKIALLTVACHDTKAKVSAYMREKSFTFPVAMADSTIQKDFAVDSWPTKLLITPSGRYILIPYHADWVSYVKAYVGF